jgi:hypothetical protein
MDQIFAAQELHEPAAPADVVDVERALLEIQRQRSAEA